MEKGALNWQRRCGGFFVAAIACALNVEPPGFHAIVAVTKARRGGRVVDCGGLLSR